MTDEDSSFSRLLRSKLHKVELAIDMVIESILLFYLNSFYDVASLTVQLKFNI